MQLARPVSIHLKQVLLYEQYKYASVDGHTYTHMGCTSCSFMYARVCLCVCVYVPCSKDEPRMCIRILGVVYFAENARDSFQAHMRMLARVLYTLSNKRLSCCDALRRVAYAGACRHTSGAKGVSLRKKTQDLGRKSSRQIARHKSTHTHTHCA